MGFDISRLATRKFVEGGKDFQLVNPTDGKPLEDENGKPVTFNLSGAECSRIKAAIREREAARSVLAKEAKAADAPAPTFDPIDDQIADLVTLTNGWSDNVTWGGEPFPFSKENAEKIYREAPFIMEWATDKVVRRINFMPAGSRT